MFFAAATFVLAFVILLILANVMHLEKGGTDSDAHKTTGLAWVFIVVSLVIGMCIGALPGMYDNVTRPLLEKGGVNFSASADTNASASASASATATTGSLDASAEGIRQTTKHFASIKKNGRKLTNFPVIGDGWEWYVLDSSVSTTIGQKVTTGEYEVTDASVTSVTVYIARNVGGTWEFGDPRPFSL